MSTEDNILAAVAEMNALPDISNNDSERLRGFVRMTATEIKAVGGIGAATSLEMIGYIRELEHKLARVATPIAVPEGEQDAFEDYLPLTAVRVAPGEYEIKSRDGRTLWRMEGAALADWVCASVSGYDAAMRGLKHLRSAAVPGQSVLDEIEAALISIADGVRPQEAVGRAFNVINAARAVAEPGFAPEPAVTVNGACFLCEKGFPIKDGVHYGTQSLGMIPSSLCATTPPPTEDKQD